MELVAFAVWCFLVALAGGSVGLVLANIRSIPGALLGSRLTGRLSDTPLVCAIALILLVAATAMAAQALI